MNKLSRKLFLRTSGIICFVFVLSYLLTTFFLPSYILHQKKINLAELTSKLETMDIAQLLDDVEKLEYDYNVTIVQAPFRTDINKLNGLVRDELHKKGITLSKFWITEESYEKLEKHETVRKIYSQEKLETSFLVTFLNKNGTLFVIGDSIAHSSAFIQMVNEFNLYLAIGTLLLTIGLSWLISRQIVRPLSQLRQTAEDISHLSFQKSEIQTGDEIESLAESINIMSDKLKEALEALEEKNQNLRIFISDISHELKTPISLIKAYSTGIKDGLDDGTFIDVIKRQADDMSGIVDKLLNLSKLQNDSFTMESFDFCLLWKQTIDKYQIAIQQKDLILTVEDCGLSNCFVVGDRAKIEIVLDNFISNAVKYTKNQQIEILLQRDEEHLVFCIKNGIEYWDSKYSEKIWQPFYVIESSRNKNLSGTGLGLSIVQTILQKHHASFGVRVEQEIIAFYFTMPLANVMK
ncbi:HAMP domain-containing sensor histidine kinase [Brevibacillus laterosporus]|uniref:sensor histidine kinase n=1 Tax=Brevibacillus laterosporus TaxID=1465 RepID=UPI000367336E|nr:HAMP domain-containing sensor histidine kinase [Brevibacillus laterosporus]ATO49021.1 two-component sensor histidine kinase [Brevibacillus laterosporus DSM 25]MED2001931.1 HAMP domain-containing sensor histidine kinase [Brevibacillus laterosporus]